MSRLLSAGFFALLLTTSAPLRAVADESEAQPAGPVPIVAVAPLTNPTARHHAKAPADEYFGRLKLSILGVRNVIYDIDARADNAPENAAAAMCHKLMFVEDALRDWQAKYPDDGWIPKFGYAMLKDYEKIDSDILSDDAHPAGVHAVDLSTWLDSTYPNSEFAPR